MTTRSLSQEIIPSRTERNKATRTTLLLVGIYDAVIVGAAAHLALFVRFWLLKNQSFDLWLRTAQEYQWHIILAALTLPLLHYYRRGYTLSALTRYRYAALQMFASAFGWSLIFVSFTLFFDIQPPISRVWVALVGLFAGTGLGTFRYFFCKNLVAGDLLRSTRRKTLFVGWNDQAQQFYERSDLADRNVSFFPFSVRSCVLVSEKRPDQDDDQTACPDHIYQGHDMASLEKQIQSGRHDTLILANSGLSSQTMLHLQELCGREMMDFMVLPDFFHTLQSSLQLETIAGLPMLTQNQHNLIRGCNPFCKRLFDIVGALVGLSLSAPFIAYFSWLVYRESPGSVFYRQVRTGADGKPFNIIKIRSMRLDAEKDTGVKWCTKEDNRRLKVGSFMRKYNIDELPQFWNVLKGEMSLVGPRPERPELIQNFKNEIRFYNVRHHVKPGITGWAQINGWRGDTCLESRIACDLEYIERWTIWFDIYICFKTLIATKNAY